MLILHRKVNESLFVSVLVTRHCVNAVVQVFPVLAAGLFMCQMPRQLFDI
jgi:hypothetical protein